LELVDLFLVLAFDGLFLLGGRRGSGAVIALLP